MHGSLHILRKMRSRFFINLIIGVFIFTGCKTEPDTLPYLGHKQVENGDSVYHRIPDFHLIDQDSNDLRISELENKIYIADFFFTSCPSICPKVTKQMLRIYDKYKDDNRVVLISHTIDQRYDSVSVLHRYARNLGVDTDQWKFVTGEKDSIFHLADQYFVSVVEDPSAPKGFDHSGRIILLDKDRHVRGFCEGTDPASVTAFMETVDKLLAEQYP